MTVAVDPDDVSTWPAGLVKALRGALTRLRDTDYASDLAIPLSEEQLAELFEGRPLRVYHATRLLEHESLGVRHEGLRALNAQHVQSRIEAAVGSGAITAADADLIRQTTAYACSREGRWEGQVCAVVGRTTLVREAPGLELFLSCWGGEAIYWLAPPTTKQILRRLGTPSIVVIDLPVDGEALWSPQLARVLAGHLAGLPNRTGQVTYRDSIPASSIATIWQPGNPEYDRLRGLPRE